MSYSQLTENKRYQIYALKKAGHSQHEIAEYIACSPSTISRELKRNSGQRGYRPKQAQQFSQERRKTAHKARKVTEEVYEKIKILIRQELSPQQVVGYMEKFERTSLHHGRFQASCRLKFIFTPPDFLSNFFWFYSDLSVPLLLDPSS